MLLWIISQIEEAGERNNKQQAEVFMDREIFIKGMHSFYPPIHKSYAHCG